jgi:FAD/FMN-containing dehydrogenase
MMIAFSRRDLLAGLGASAAAFSIPNSFAQPRLVLNDASRLNPTPVVGHWVAAAESEADVIARLRKELKDAASAKRPVCVSAARHSMGGQSLPRNGQAITLDLNICEPDRAKKTFRVHAGTRWYQVIEHLAKIGFSPAVMQSNSDFGVASTFSVNAHGWPVPYGPFGATVRSLRLMLADGTIVTCSRDQNAELFGLAMGGYGLVGIILDLEVEMVENLWLRPTYELMPAESIAAKFYAATRDPAVKMMYGRLNVARQAFFSEALMVTYRSEPAPASGLPPVSRGGGFMTSFSRDLYRAQTGWETMKNLRWFAETVANPLLSSGLATRSNLMNEPVVNLEARDRSRTDILHEYFVAPDRFNDFLQGCSRIIPKAKSEFLNVTLRYVAKDDTSVLAFAQTDRIAAVMSFSQAMTPEGEVDMLTTTEALIEMIGAIGGSFYLPYRLHARSDQIDRIYPRAGHFVERKKHYDPALVFRNLMWDTYFAG